MDTRDTRVQNLFFLLSAAPLGVGCVIADDGETDTAVTTVNPPTTEGDTEAATTTSTGTPSTESVGETTVGPVSTDDRGETETTVTPEDTTMTPDDTTAGIDIPPACQTYGEAIEACFAGYGEYAATSCANYHAMYTESYGAECIAAFEEWLACLSGLSCEDLGMEEPEACAKQTMARDTACAPA